MGESTFLFWLPELALKLAGGDGDGDKSHYGENVAVDAKFGEAWCARDYSASNVDVVSRRDD